MTYLAGTGALIGSSWSTRQALTRSGDGTFAALMGEWFFEGLPPSADFTPGYGALAGVLTAWTGSLYYDDGTVTVTVTARGRESVASLFARLIHEVYVRTDDQLLLSVSLTGVITISGPNVFELGLSSNHATRTGFSGVYTGAAIYTADDPYEQGWVADRGMRMDAPLWATSGERGAVGDGSGATAPTRAPARARYVAWDSVTHLPDLTREHDYWHDGRLFGRFIIESARLVPLGITRTDENITVEIDIGESA